MDKEVKIQKAIKEHIDFQLRLLSILILVSIMGLSMTYLLEAPTIIQRFFLGTLITATLYSASYQKNKAILIIIVGVIIPAITLTFDTELGVLMIFTTILNIPGMILMKKMIEHGARDHYKNHE